MGHLTLLSLAAAKRYVRGWMRWRDDWGTKMLRLVAVTAALLAGLGACQQHGPAGTQIGVVDTRRASPPPLDSNYLLTPSGGYVLSSPPPGAQITVGSKLVRRADGGDAPAGTSNN
jgi:hypothetical protein